MSPHLDRPQLILANRGLMPEQMAQELQVNLFHSTSDCGQFIPYIFTETEDQIAKDRFICLILHMAKIILRIPEALPPFRTDIRAKPQQNRPNFHQTPPLGQIRENIVCKNRDFRILHCGKGALFGNTYFLTQL